MFMYSKHDCPDMIKIRNSQGQKYIPERDVMALHIFLCDRYYLEPEYLPCIEDAMLVFRSFFMSQELPFGTICYMSEDGKKCEEVTFINTDYVDKVLDLIARYNNSY